VCARARALERVGGWVFRVRTCVFECFEQVEEILNKSKFLFPWQSKVEAAWFRGSCWYYKRHGRTAAMSMSEVSGLGFRV